MSHDHDHSHLSDMDARVRALESLLTEKGYIETAALDRIIETYEHRIGPQNGAHVVAKAWTEPDFAEWLKRDATAAIHSLGYVSRQGEHMEALFNTPETHHMVVCTLCSCYPWSVLGLPPTWYKSPPYRARAVADPRGVLADFGVTLLEGSSVEVHDSTAETRYIVIPMKPDGDHDAETFAGMVTRNGMIGTALL
ncbi:MAG: nitrile hydratase subunit alpha [Pseudomonadota bacterium]